MGQVNLVNKKALSVRQSFMVKISMLKHSYPKTIPMTIIASIKNIVVPI